MTLIDFIMNIYRAATEAFSGLPKAFFSKAKKAKSIVIDKKQVEEEAHKLVKMYGVKGGNRDAQLYADTYLEKIALKLWEDDEDKRNACEQVLFWTEVGLAINKLYLE